jgi:hypothetical protein
MESAKKFINVGKSIATMFGLIKDNFAKKEYGEARFKPPSTAVSFGKLTPAQAEFDVMLKAECFISLSAIQNA